MALTGMRSGTAVRSTPAPAYEWTAIALAGIWLSVVLASIFAPPMVTGTQHDQAPVAAFADWIWGAIATGAVLRTSMKGIRVAATSRSAWMTLGISVAVVWVGVLLVSLFTPDFVTGTDPTRLPFGAMLSPIAGSVLTGIVCSFVRAGFRRPKATVDLARAVPLSTASTVSQPALAADPAAALRQILELRDAGAITQAEFDEKKRELLSRI